MYEYNVNLVKVVDGDTIDVDIDLGFGMWVRNERIRLVGIDAPESRTSDKVQKLFGLISKQRVIDYFKFMDPDVTKEERKPVFVLISKEFNKGKYGRILGDVRCSGVDGQHLSLCRTLISEGHAVPYNGENKDLMQSEHLINRSRLIFEQKVAQSDVDNAERLNTV